MCGHIRWPVALPALRMIVWERGPPPCRAFRFDFGSLLLDAEVGGHTGGLCEYFCNFPSILSHGWELEVNTSIIGW